MVKGNLYFEEFLIAGISLRTINEADQSQMDIGNLWSRFFRDKVIETLPRKISDEIYCLYSGYDPDHLNIYDTTIGCRIESVKNLPPGLVMRKISSGKYAHYISAGKLPQCVVATWREIWQTRNDRIFTSDFDVYGEKARDMTFAEVETFLSIV